MAIMPVIHVRAHVTTEDADLRNHVTRSEVEIVCDCGAHLLLTDGATEVCACNAVWRVGIGLLRVTTTFEAA